MIKYPLYFKGQAASSSGMATVFEAEAEGLTPIKCAVPKEFLGPGGGYSPEDLYLLAITGCLIATFKVFAEKAKLSYEKISGEAELMIDRNGQGVPELKKVDLHFTLKGADDREKAETLFAEAKKYCLVSNAVKSELTFHFTQG